MTQLPQPKLQTLNQFRKHFSHSTTWNSFTGETKKIYRLYNTRQIITNCDNYLEAFDCYQFYFQAYDKFVKLN